MLKYNFKDWIKAAVMGNVDWVMVASASALAGIVSLLTSVAGLPELDNQ